MLAPQILRYIKEEYAKGRTTQQEIAAALNIDHQTINRLLSGKRKPEGLTIGTFDKMFPRAEVKLTGHSINVSMLKDREITERSMDIFEEIIAHLKKEYASGATYQELAIKYGVSYTHIHNLLNGKRAVSGISIDLLFHLFPQAQISLYGDVAKNNLCSMEEIMDKILNSEELTAEEKVKVLKVLPKKFSLGNMDE